MAITHNGKTWNVVVVTPAGRERHLKILSKILEKETIIDGWQLWVNTNIESDIAYINTLRADVKTLNLGEYSPFNICKFYQFAQDKDTVYVRIDDDIVFIEEGAIEKLVKCRLDNPEPYMVSANIVNNTIMGFIHEKIGALKGERRCSYLRMDEVGHKDKKHAEIVHDTFQDKFKNNKLSDYYFPNWTLTDYEEFSICSFAFFGKDNYNPAPDEEVYISSTEPRQTSRPNMICGDALMVHYGYHTQREHLDSKNYLKLYD